MSERGESGQTFGVLGLRPQLGTYGAAAPAPVARLPIFYVDLPACRALVVVVVHIAVSLAYGVPRWDLRHHIYLRASGSVRLQGSKRKLTITTADGCDFAHHYSTDFPSGSRPAALV